MKQVLTALAAAVMVPAATLFSGSPAVSAQPQAGMTEVCTTSGQETQLAARTGQESVFTLVTGERVDLTTSQSGVATWKLLPPVGSPQDGSPAFVRFDRDGDQYLVPAEAVPYLGSVLDPRLFDISYLARAGLGGPRQPSIPVTVVYRGAPVTLPGMRITRAFHGGADETLGTPGTAALGAMLASDWRTLHAGRPLTAGDPLRGVSWIGLKQAGDLPPLPTQATIQAGAVSGARPPHYRTLTIRFIGTDGQPGAAIGWAQNLNDGSLSAFEVPALKPTDPMLGQPGPVRFSVPDGSYSLQFSIVTPHPGSLWGVDAALVVDPQVTVTSNTTVTIDARTAKLYKPQIAPAVPDRYRMDQLLINREGAAQRCAANQNSMGLVSLSAEGFAGSRLMAAPTAPVRMGALRFLGTTVIFPGAEHAPAEGPRYYLEFPDTAGIPANLSSPVPQTSLTTVRERVIDPPGACTRSGGLFSPFVYTSWGNVQQLDDEPGPGGVLAGDHVNYWYSAQPQLTRWQDMFLTMCQGMAFEAQNSAQEIRPGQHLSHTWGSGPKVPSPVAAPGAQFINPPDSPFGTIADYAPATRQNDLAFLNLTFGDSDPSHFSAAVLSTWLGAVYPPANQIPLVDSNLAFWRDGELVSSSSELPARFQQTWPDPAILPLLPRPASYRLLWSATPYSPGKSTTTDWSFRSAPAGDGQVPSSLPCGLGPVRPCSYLPLLFPEYHLALNAHSQIKAGVPFRVEFSVLHQQGEASPSGVTADVAVSFNDGKTWTTPVPAAAAGHGFAATLSIPRLTATNGFMALRVTARDASGNSVTQTVIRAVGLIS